MSKQTTVAIVAVCILAAVIIAGIALFGLGVITINPDAGNQGGNQGPAPSGPTSVPTSVPTSGPVNTDTPQTPQGPELTPLQKEGISLLAGKWYGNDPITVKVGIFPITMPSEFNAEAKDDFTARFWGVVKDVPTMEEPLTFNLPVAWEYKGNHKFTGTTDDGSQIDFTCDGTYIDMVVNPYKHGLTDNSMANMDIPIKLHRV